MDQKQVFSSSPKAQVIRQLRDDIANALNDVKCDESWDKQMFALFFLDMLYMLEAKAILSKAIATNNFRIPQLSIDTLLANRWKFIKNTPLCYTLTPYSPHNVLLKKLARNMYDPDSVNKKLMPSLPVNDVYENDLSNIKSGEIILTSNGRQYIHLPSMIDTAISRFTESEKDCLVLWDVEKKMLRPINDIERARIVSVHPLLGELFKFLSAKDRTENYSLRKELQKLRNGLRLGDKNNEGDEKNAGSPSNLAVKEFRKYWELLPYEAQEQIGELSGVEEGSQTFREIWENLVNPDVGDVSTCVQLKGDYVDNILQNPLNQEILEASHDIHVAVAGLREIQRKFNVLVIESRVKAGEIILTGDDEGQYIHLSSMLDNAISLYGKSEKQCLLVTEVSETGKQSLRPLNQLEIEKIVKAHPSLKGFFSLVSPIRTALMKLQDELTSHAVDSVSGNNSKGISPAFQEFQKVWKTLPFELQKLVYDLTGTKEAAQSFGAVHRTLLQITEHKAAYRIVTLAYSLYDILHNPENQIVLSSSIRSGDDKVLAELKKMKEEFDIKVAGINERIEKTPVTQDVKFTRDIWSEYYSKMWSTIHADTCTDSTPVSMLKNFIFKMVEFFPDENKSLRQYWANVFIMLNRLVIELPLKPSVEANYFTHEAWVRLKCLAYYYGRWNKGHIFSDQIDNLYAAFLRETPKKLKFELPIRYESERLQTQFCQASYISSFIEKNVTVTVKVNLEDDYVLFISLLKDESSIRRGKVKVKPMEYNPTTKEWQYVASRDRVELQSGFGFWRAKKQVSETGKKTRNSDMLGWYRVDEPRACHHVLDESKFQPCVMVK